MRPMIRITGPLVVLPLILSCFAASALERIKKRPPTAAEAERIASEMAKNDSLLKPGDIVATDRGFVVFRGVGPDGVTNDFVPVPNPLSAKAR
jgi:hypothetical protein